MGDIEISEPKQLQLWLGYHRPDLKISEQDIGILLGYFEGHDYGLVIRDDVLMRKDLAEENGEIEPYDMDDVIDIVCEWNYELLYEEAERMEHAKNFIDYCECRVRHDSLQKDALSLTTLFEQTRYGRQTKQVVEKILAKGSMKGMEDMEYTVCTPVIAHEANVPDKDGKVR